jgi:hypothetical protein
MKSHAAICGLSFAVCFCKLFAGFIRWDPFVLVLSLWTRVCWVCVSTIKCCFLLNCLSVLYLSWDSCNTWPWLVLFLGWPPHLGILPSRPPVTWFLLPYSSLSPKTYTPCMLMSSVPKYVPSCTLQHRSLCLVYPSQLFCLENLPYPSHNLFTSQWDFF